MPAIVVTHATLLASVRASGPPKKSIRSITLHVHRCHSGYDEQYSRSSAKLSQVHECSFCTFRSSSSKKRRSFLVFLKILELDHHSLCSWIRRTTEKAITRLGLALPWAFSNSAKHSLPIWNELRPPPPPPHDSALSCWMSEFLLHLTRSVVSLFILANSVLSRTECGKFRSSLVCRVYACSPCVLR